MSNFEIPESGLDSSINDLIAQTKTEIPVLTEEVLSGLYEFDGTDFNIFDAVNVVGVFAGIKPTALLTTISAGGVNIESVFNRMGLTCVNVDPRTFVLSRHCELADAMADLYEQGGCRTDDAQMQRSVGKLLGFPETATEYYVERLQFERRTGVLIPAIEFPGLESSGEYGRMHNFRQFILSPSHAAEEVAQYCEPLRQATEIMTPHLYERVLEKPGVQPRDRLLIRAAKSLASFVKRKHTK